MRHPILVLTVVCSLAAGGARAQFDGDAPLGPNLLVIDPGALFNGIVSVEYERALAPWFGIAVGAAVWAFRPVFLDSAQPHYAALIPRVAARFHFFREAPGGLWLGPSVTAGYVIARSDGLATRAFGWGLGAEIGYNLVSWKHFVFQLGAGGRFTDLGDRFVWTPSLILGFGAVF